LGEKNIWVKIQLGEALVVMARVQKNQLGEKKSEVFEFYQFFIRTLPNFSKI
jgi:hypothetical protein